MRCARCHKQMKERLVTEEFVGSQCQVTITGIPAGVCSYCGHQAMDAEALDEIQMFVQPLLSGGIGMRMLRTPHLTIDLGHSMHPSAIDIAGPSFPLSAGPRTLDALNPLEELEPVAGGEVRAA